MPALTPGRWRRRSATATGTMIAATGTTRATATGAAAARTTGSTRSRTETTSRRSSLTFPQLEYIEPHAQRAFDLLVDSVEHGHAAPAEPVHPARRKHLGVTGRARPLREALPALSGDRQLPAPLHGRRADASLKADGSSLRPCRGAPRRGGDDARVVALCPLQAAPGLPGLRRRENDPLRRARAATGLRRRAWSRGGASWGRRRARDRALKRRAPARFWPLRRVRENNRPAPRPGGRRGPAGGRSGRRAD